MGSSESDKARRALPSADFTTPEAEHPEWVRAKFPEYVEHGHAVGPFSSVRTLNTHGKVIAITTTYEVTIDGEPVSVHMMVDSDGRLWSHLCPYSTFQTATDLVRYVLENAPEALEGLLERHGQRGSRGNHGGHS